MLILKAGTILLKLKETSNTILVVGSFWRTACKKVELTGVMPDPGGWEDAFLATEC
jgi:hypothetical protein